MHFVVPSYLPFPISPFDIYCVILIWKRKNWAGNEFAIQKKWLVVTLKDFLKQIVIKQTPTFLSFSYLIDCCNKCYFLFPYQSIYKFLKIDKISLAGFLVYKNDENLKMLIETFCQKLTVSKVILAFLDYLKPNIFLVGQPWWPTSLFKISGSAPVYNATRKITGDERFSTVKQEEQNVHSLTWFKLRKK